MNKVIAIFMCALICTFCGCRAPSSSAETSVSKTSKPSQPKAPENPKKTLADYVYNVMSDEEYNAIAEQIQWEKLDLSDYDVGKLLFYSSKEVYGIMRVASEYFCHIGLSGLPVLVDVMSRVEKDTDHVTVTYIYPIAYYTVLRINLPYTKEPPCDHTAENIHKIKKDSETACEEIISKNVSSREKLDVLREWGIYGLPYVLEEIEKGNTEFESFFTEIGLHLSHREYVEIGISEHFQKEMYEKLKQTGSPTDFDYKVWLSENEEDLNNLFAYLDAYCAEYEAENK